MTPFAIDISPGAVTRRLIIAEVVMVGLSLTGEAIMQAVSDWHHVGKLGRVVRWFDVDEEQSVQTFFSIAQLLLASGLVGLVAGARMRNRDAFRWHWAMLALLLLAMAIDEQIGVHESLTRPMRRLLGQPTLGMLYDAWVLPALAAVAIVGVAFARFLAHLPGKTRTRIIVAATVFVGGAVGFEMLSGVQVEAHGNQDNLLYILFSHLEEMMEMLGITLFVRAMLYYIVDHVGELRLRVVS